MTKRLFDIILSGAGLIVISPLLATIAVAIKLTSRGEIFYRGERIGRFGRPFRILKFRTMVADAESIGGSSTGDDDPRITPMGGWLRKYKLDELPQLLNVLKGDMSLVGPRPQVAWAVELYEGDEKRLLDVRPGITDYASIAFRNEGEILRGEPDPDEAYLRLIAPEKTRLSLKYVNEQSLWVDCRIIARTICAVLGFQTKEPLA